MLDLPGNAILDKAALIGGCVRLPLRFDANRLRDEIDGLPTDLWGTTGGRVGVHSAAEALFLRGYAPAQGDKPIENRPPLDLLPYAKEIIEQLIPASPMRCLLAKLPGGAAIAPHIDRAPYFAKTMRLHFPVITHDRAWMFCAGKSYVMKPGEIWALNNNALHAVWNEDAFTARTHMICDFLLSSQLRALIETSDRHLGQYNRAVEQYLATVPARHGAG
jgi:Aspartyl/Asparaginyl beta-hydroxylase